jgi:hypothetical protein
MNSLVTAAWLVMAHGLLFTHTLASAAAMAPVAARHDGETSQGGAHRGRHVAGKAMPRLAEGMEEGQHRQEARARARTGHGGLGVCAWLRTRREATRGKGERQERGEASRGALASATEA